MKLASLIGLLVSLLVLSGCGHMDGTQSILPSEGGASAVSDAGSSVSYDTSKTAASLPVGERYFFIAPAGDDTAAGTEDEPWATLSHAVTRAEPGDVLVMREGRYPHGERIDINRNGTKERPIVLTAFPGEIPVLDFSAQEEQPGWDGIRLNADYWHLIGIHLTRAGGNGFRIHGSHNLIERCVAFENRLTGIHLEDGSHNLIVNNDSFRNFNLRRRVGNMADGFAAKYEALGPGNVFYGNRAWENSDDGFDLWMASSVITLENNWSFANGKEEIWREILDNGGHTFEGGGNGFKLGGNHIAGNHIVKGNMAFDNHGKGFDHNNNSGALTLIHNTGDNNGITINGRNFDFPNAPAAGGRHVFINNLDGVSRVSLRIAEGSEQRGNSWQGGEVTAEMFVSVDTAQAKAPRRPDGSLPDILLFVPKPDSFLATGGVERDDPSSVGGSHIGARKPER